MSRTRQLITLLVAMAASLSLASAEETVSLPGIWKATADLPDGDTNKSTVTFSQDGDKLKGSVVGDEAKEREITRIKTEGTKVTLEIEIEINDQSGVVKIEAEESESGKLAGTWALIDSAGEERAQGSWKAERISEPSEDASTKSASIAGKWNATATRDNGEELQTVVTFAGPEDEITGNYKSDRGQGEFDSVKVKGKDIEVKFVIQFNDNRVNVRIEAELKDDDHLKGKWIIFDASGQEAASGPWEAKRLLELDLTGIWEAVATTENGKNEHQAVFEKGDDGFKGHVKTDEGGVDYTVIKVDENNVALEIPFGEGTVKIAASYTEKNKLTGKWTYFDASDSFVESNDWTATKQIPKKPDPSVVGQWEVGITWGDNQRAYALDITKEGDSLKGVLSRPNGNEIPCDSVSFEDKAFELKVTRTIRGNEVQFIYKGSWVEDDTLSGTLSPVGYEDQFSADWTAKRKS